MESKMAIYNLIPKHYYPKTVLIDSKLSALDLTNIVKEQNFNFPIIAKPDIGLRGAAVKKITAQCDLEDYHKNADFDYLIQDFIPYQNEIGVFYVRFPNDVDGFISGVVYKEPLAVLGDGVSTIETLLKQTPRFRMQLKSLQNEYGQQLKAVLKKGTKQVLVRYGSHCRGAKFRDCGHLISPALTEAINKICKTIPGFYYGRLDIMYNSFIELERGKNFMIVEINGAKSEPAHIYDPKHSLFFGWREIAKHIGYMYTISVQNLANSNACHLNYKQGIKEMLDHFAQHKKIVGF